ncbi:hypothetical protein C1645_782738 [Glomus cerebriforme]|uniref:Uncharacterized protein n=1 Tax=Glomus cerebriforme TaxID=658196 RepID=A0A397SFQ8_9GLOM|nr:hypothetical protein C1645_782738 [Glomus cerebriforme]
MSTVEYQNELLLSSTEDVNTIFVPSSHLSESPLEDPYLFEGEECINQEFYYYYNNQLTAEEQAMLGVAYNNNNEELYMDDQVNSIITWSPELELQDQNYIMNGYPYLYNDVIENDIFDSYNPFLGQSSIYEESNIITNVGDNLLLTQPLSEVTQNVIENQQFLPYNWCDLSSFPDTQQQFIIENNISSKIEHNLHNHHQQSHQNQQNHITPEYTPWTDFQLLEA